MGAEDVHVFMVTMAMQGHMNPMLKLAKWLVSKGIHVTFATTEVARHRMLKSEVSSAPNTTPGISFEFFSDGLSMEFDRNRHLESFIGTLRTVGSKNVSNLITNLTTQNKRFSCIISNPFLPWVPDVAAEHGIPCAFLWIQASAIYSIYYHYFKNPNLFPSLEDQNAAVDLPGLPVLLVSDLPTFILPGNPPVMHKLASDFVQSLDKVKWILGNSFHELEEDTVMSMASIHPITPIGPLVSPFLLGKEDAVNANIDMWSTEDSCIEWLNKQQRSSVIYISFGSVIVLSQQQMDAIATGLKNSNKPFLWVIKPADKSAERQGGELSAGFLEQTQGKGFVVKWCPQEKVLMHPAVACFMTHCGWNSCIETLVTGVPVIAYPEWTDQPTDAKLLVDVFKMGVRLRTEEDGTLKAEEFERCIMEITDGASAKEMKERAMELKEAARKAVTDGGSSDRNLDHFLSEVGCNSC